MYCIYYGRPRACFALCACFVGSRRRQLSGVRASQTTDALLCSTKLSYTDAELSTLSRRLPRNAVTLDRQLTGTVTTLCQRHRHQQQQHRTSPSSSALSATASFPLLHLAATLPPAPAADYLLVAPPAHWHQRRAPAAHGEVPGAGRGELPAGGEFPAAVTSSAPVTSFGCDDCCAGDVPHCADDVV